MFSEDLKFLGFGSCFQRTKGFWILAYVFKGPRILGLGSCRCVWPFTLVLAK